MSGHYSKPYEQILFTNQLQQNQSHQNSKPYEKILFTNNSQNSPPPVQPKSKEETPPLSEESKMDLYSKVNKRRSPPVISKSSLEDQAPLALAPAQSSTSSSSGSPPPLETIAPSRRIR